jgi:alanine-synthesizing transaminase
MAEGNVVRVPLRTPEDFLDNVEREAKRGERPVKAVMVSFPQNPTTLTVDPEFFVNLVGLAHAYGFWVIHDFAYADLGFDGYEPPSFLQADGAREVGVEIFSMSKSYNMAGWRVGFCLGNRQLIQALARIKSYLDYGIFQPIQIAATVALRRCEDSVESIRETYRWRRNLLIRGLNQSGWPVEPSRASMFVWAPIPDPWRELGSLEFARRLLLEGEVAVSPGIGFGIEGEGFVRFALIENEARIRQALRGIKRMLAQKAVAMAAQER